MWILVTVFALAALAAMAGWAFTLVQMTRAVLPNAQAYQALSKLSNEMDDRVRSVLENMQRRSGKQIDPTKPVDELEEARRRAATMGLKIDTDGNVSERDRAFRPPPDAATVDLDMVE
jgi:hypothetical protein